ncbi:hypothetical protein Sjap_013231 [Stephania japonica]|uniref:Cytochrome P450 n=1 Tax=Stephania japonica TaxID=461633 RepID=A0AAP0IXM1_9MAGN
MAITRVLLRVRVGNDHIRSCQSEPIIFEETNIDFSFDGKSEFEDEEIYVNFDEPPKFDAGDEDFIEDRVVFGDNGHVIEVISQSTSPQVLETVVDNGVVEIYLIEKGCTHRGHRNYSNHIEWGMAELLKNRTVMNKPQVEMRRVVGNNRKINEEDIEQMDYLMCVIKETLRLHPVVPTLLPRQSYARTNVGGYQIPRRTWLLINVWAIQRDPELWTQLEGFIPEDSWAIVLILKAKITSSFLTGVVEEFA